MAEKRKVYDIFISAELEGDAGVSDIVEIARAQRVPLSYIARAKIERETRSEAPQGVMALAAELEEADLGELLRTRNGVKPFLVAVDGVTDPGNLGAIIRNCDGAGVTGVLLPKHRAVHVTPTVAKASAGAIEHVPIALVPGLPATLTQLKDHGIWIVGLDDAADRDLFRVGVPRRRADLPRARLRRRRSVAIGAAALRLNCGHSDARPGQLAKCLGCSGACDLRDHARAKAFVGLMDAGRPTRLAGL